MSEQPTARASATSNVATTDVVTDDADDVVTEVVAPDDEEIDDQHIDDEHIDDDRTDTVAEADTGRDTDTAVIPAVEEAVVPTPTPVIDNRPRVRRVTRVLRSIDTWTVFKVALVFHFVLYLSALVSGVLIWNVAQSTGTVDNVERFMETFGWETFKFDGGQLFGAAWRIGLFAVIGLTGLAVLAATTFNLITDIVGGIRVTVLEEEVVAVRRPGSRRSAAAPRASRRHG